jgi:hypothetical protein
MRYWKVAPGDGGSLWVEQRENDCLAIGWNDTGDLSKYENDEEITKKHIEIWGKKPVTLLRFFHEVKKGDKIVASSGRYIFAIGTVKSSRYKYNNNLSYCHSKSVRWDLTFWDPLDIYTVNLDYRIQKRLNKNTTLLELEKNEWEEIENVLFNIKNPFKNMNNWDGLLRSPIYEQEVIILFSKLTQYLKMRIERFSTRFPDAYLRVKIGKKWILKSAEFEIYSSAFVDHGHLKDMKENEKECDMIICWIHDWDHVPENIKVIELREKFLEII